MKLICAGDCGVDRYVNLERDRPGGKTLNFAVTAKRLFPSSTHIGLVTAIGNDPESRLVWDAVDRFGLEASRGECHGKTSIQYIDQEPSGEKIFVRYEQGVLGDYRIDASERRAIEESDLLVTVLYSEIHEFFRSVIEAPSSGLRTVDFSDLSDFGDNTDVVDEYVHRFDVGFFSLRSADGRLIENLEQLARQRRKLFIVTLGPHGSLALSAADRISCRAAPVAQVVDTTGAGDVFAAGFLSEYCRSRDVPASLEMGSRHAAASIQQIGAFQC